eukprot:4526600-Pyramimonas_sp.AAC.1
MLARTISFLIALRALLHPLRPFPLITTSPDHSMIKDFRIASAWLERIPSSRSAPPLSTRALVGAEIICARSCSQSFASPPCSAVFANSASCGGGGGRRRG